MSQVGQKTITITITLDSGAGNGESDIAARLTALEEGQAKTMTLIEDERVQIARLNDITTELGGEISDVADKLKAATAQNAALAQQLADAGITQDDIDGLTSIGDKLQGDVTALAPPAPPTPAPSTGSGDTGGSVVNPPDTSGSPSPAPGVD